jgi:UDP-GlcNAc:undecaprenyl-phosphate/decaprenyl-phosphate GlcNAc-1-phosphate transferase
MLNVLSLAVPAIIAICAAVLLTPAARALAFRVGALDVPDSRKVHGKVMPRLGGLAVIGAILLALLAIQTVPALQKRMLTSEMLLALALGLLPVIVVSFIDDIRPLRAAPKFAAHILGASMAVSVGIRLNPEITVFGDKLPIGWLAIPISIIWIAGITNAFNIVDGLDGLSAGLALISALSLGAVSLVVGKYPLAVAAFAIAGGLLGFLPYNIHPAKIFLGDTGSASVGFLLGCLALGGGTTLNAGLAIIVPLLALGLPLAETFVSMARRALRRLEGDTGAQVFGADRRHFHHRLLDLGLTHRNAVLTLYGVGVILALCGFLSAVTTTGYSALILGALVVAAFIGIRHLGYDEFAVIRRGTVLKVYDAPVLRSAAFVVFLDLLLVMAAIYGAIALKWDDWGLVEHRALAQHMAAVLPALAVVVFWSFGLYRGAWRVASVEDFTRSAVSAVVASAVGATSLAFFLYGSAPVTFWIVYTMVLAALVTGMRASYRLLANWNARSSTEGTPVLIYGAGKAGLMALREMQTSRDSGLRPIGFVDDNASLTGRVINGYPVLGSIEDVDEILRSRRAAGVVISSAKVSRERMLTIKKTCDAHNVPLQYFSIGFNNASFVEAPVAETLVHLSPSSD